MAISTNKFLSQSTTLIDAIVKVLEVETYDPEDFIVSQGETGSHFYIIAKGDCEVYVTDEKQRQRFVHKIG